MPRVVLSALLSLLLSCPVLCGAAEPAKSAPPSPVVVSEVREGMVSPTAQFIGSVSYPQISEVAAEVEGRTAQVLFEEGDRVKRGEALVVLDADVLAKEILAMQASQAQAASEAKKATLDAERFAKLFQDETVSRQEYENYLYAMESLSHRADSLAADVEVLKVQLAKKTLVAPFAGVILQRRAEPGQWVSKGTVVASLGRDEEVDIQVDIPEEIIPFLQPGQQVSFSTSRGRQNGKLVAIIPQGDIKTRTFPIKLRANNTLGLYDGMEAKVELPTSRNQSGFIVPRDALVSQMGRNLVFTVQDGVAHAISVKVTGYLESEVGVLGEGLRVGMSVVIKGNERLREGQAVAVQAKE